VKSFLQDLTEVPSYEEDPSYYSDWGDPREYTMDDYGEGECAGEIVPLVEFGLQASEREVFEAQLYLDSGRRGQGQGNGVQAPCSPRPRRS
jgi:sulfite reductase (ferredoxin)